MSLIFAMLLVSAQAPDIQQPAGPQAAAAQPAKPKKEKKICHTEDDVTGSHMVKRTCLTQQEWDSRVQGRTMDEFSSTAPKSH